MRDPDPDDYDVTQRTLPGRAFGRVTLDIDPGEPDDATEQTIAPRSHTRPLAREELVTVRPAPPSSHASGERRMSQPREPASVFSDKTRAVVAAGDPRVAAMRELYAAGDADAARFIAETISRDDETLGDATAVPVTDGRTVVGSAGANLAAAISRMSVPRLVRRATDLEGLPIDHRAGFLIAHIDSKMTMQEILDVCAMPEGDAVEIVRQLSSMGIIVFT